jgi:hypothetical protein
MNRDWLRANHLPADVDNLRFLLYLGKYEDAYRALANGCPWAPELAELFPDDGILWLLRHNFNVSYSAALRVLISTRDDIFDD